MRFIEGHWQLLALTALVFALWQTPVVVPIKILIVFFHEVSHGAAAWLTGGRVLELQVSAQQGGYAITAGGSRFWILTAGYLGSLAWGAALLLLALHTRADRTVLGALGGLMLLCCALYIRDSFALLFCAGAGAALLLAAWRLPRKACDLVLRVIGLTSLIYVPYDIFDDTIRRSALRSDAGRRDRRHNSDVGRRVVPVRTRRDRLGSRARLGGTQQYRLIASCCRIPCQYRISRHLAATDDPFRCSVLISWQM